MEEYTCPMHPEVRQDSPGNCPKCGVKLEPKTEQQGRRAKEEDLKNPLGWDGVFDL